jgi:hypothetical protein
LSRAYDAARNRLLDRVHQRIDVAMKTLPGSAVVAMAEADSSPRQAA